MPQWATWKLFWKVAPFVAGFLLIMGGLWYVDHRGYQRAENEAQQRETKRQLDLQIFNAMLAQQTKDLEESMQSAIMDSDGRVVGALQSLDVTNKTVIQPTLTREIQRETRFTDPATGISDGMLRELNRARGFSEQRPCPSGSNAVACFALPDTEPAEGQDNRNAGN